MIANTGVIFFVIVARVNVCTHTDVYIYMYIVMMENAGEYDIVGFMCLGNGWEMMGIYIVMCGS